VKAEFDIITEFPEVYVDKKPIVLPPFRDINYNINIKNPSIIWRLRPIK